MRYNKRQQSRIADGQVRRSQMIGNYGPGATIDLLHQAVLVGGLDFWSYPKGAGKAASIPEPRLRDQLADQFQKAGLELSLDAPFREPPDADDREPSPWNGVRVLEFPQWHVCQNPECRALVRKDGLTFKKERYWHNCSMGRAETETVPVRFLGACRNGHIQDYPWISFAHPKGGRCGALSLSLHEGATGDFSEIEVRCACGSSNRLSAAMLTKPYDCDGQRPWLGVEGKESCNQKLHLLVRTASNSYFAQVVSALSIPEPARKLEELVKNHWQILSAATAQTLPAFRTIPTIKTDLAGFSDRQVLGAVSAIQGNIRAERAPLRTAEYLQFVSAPPEQPGDIPPSDATFYARAVPFSANANPVPGITRVVLAKKLREVRAQIGFTRLEPATPDLQGEYDLEVQLARLSLTQNWLPATEVRGEGVFLQLDEQAVRAWEARAEVQRRAEELLRGYNDWKQTVRQQTPPPFPGVRFYMLHSLSHLLISAISLECGYSASAIRERIYCTRNDPRLEQPMAAILISTGTSGAEGTLGGLVEQGRRLYAHLRNAYDMGKLCSNDPVCGCHSPADDHAERHLEGAACHGCLFIAETSCERFNRYLDRALVVPTVGHPKELAFFSERP